MPVLHVRAEGYLEHVYTLKSGEHTKIVSSSLSFKVIDYEYIGRTFPPQSCVVKDVNFNLNNDRTSAVARLRYACSSTSGVCPNFLIEFSWDEEQREDFGVNEVS
ncbi:hypothetical protein [Pseudomonas sp. 10-1B]|uniref:hypothetical protein n=1 Tax=Pseudomonas sp. 10-1B TaxID=1546029 RepID=UPI00128D9B74|nr:hypothetical protein [Pseudomonas sp. 10-1B]